MELLERASFLDTLAAYADEASTGRGRLVLIAGEAGIGKTTLVETFSDHYRDANWLWGACDGLFTPRPLGPLFDIARQLTSQLEQMMLEGVPREAVFGEFLTHLDDAGPSVAIFEDVHWADEATMDLLRFVGRRIASSKCLLIVTYRNDEIGELHPLTITIGDLVGQRSTRRMTLPPLTKHALSSLAEAKGFDSEELHRFTGGNPLFVEGVLSGGSPGVVPASVREVVLARVARLRPESVATLETACVIGNRVERWLLKEVLGEGLSGIDGCIAAGLIIPEATSFRFRHEITRVAIESSVAPHRRAEVHVRVLSALQASPLTGNDAARLAYHAEAADDANAVLKYAPAAAREASQLKSHREAAAQYARALRFGHLLSAEERAELLEGHGYACFLTNDLQEAYESRVAAVDCWEAVGDLLGQGDNLRWCSRLLWFLGRNEEAEETANRAVALLEPLPPGPELAMAYSNLSHLAMLGQDTGAATEWGDRAIELAQKLGDQEILVHALNNVGTAEMYAGSDLGEERLKESLRLSRDAGLQDHVDRALTNLAETSLWKRNYESADHFMLEAIAYCSEHDLERCQLLINASQAMSAVQQGRWTEAVAIAEALLASSRPAVMSRIQALVSLSLVRLRRGQPEVDVLLDEALRLAEPIGELSRLWPVHAARAEAAWWRGDLDETGEEAAAAFDLAVDRNDPWAIGELAYWLWRAGRLSEPPSGAALPFRLHIQGDLSSAVNAWKEIGCPFEAAMALSDSPREIDLRRALDIFHELEASTAVLYLKRRMRQLGIRSIPRGPRGSTVANPANLTARETEVASLLAEGLRNAEIADRLFIAEKTVDHHVSSVLAKMGVKSRAAVVREAERLGIVGEK
jgi:DNA-binding CsgD family transcriptional regulator/tetratricopeptide (TPR) repeat protein